ncbi:MAG: radical SAM protein, partial [Planctomycetes bacterium]|nr:radical SAM protein [Planctomycetota bacterium]
MKPRILLVNPPVYDFTAYDFWIKPYGLLSVGGMLRDQADLSLFDYLDRSTLAGPPSHEAASGDAKIRRDRFGRGKYASKRVQKPDVFSEIPRYFRRFGADRAVFQRFLDAKKPFDLVLIQTVMTYWYPGVAEVIEDVRRICPGAKIVLGGVYATLCPDHARSLGADLVIEGSDLAPLASLLGTEELRRQPSAGARQGPYWEGYERLDVGVMKLTRGCPFACSYCSVPQTEPGFSTKPLAECIADLHVLCERGAANIAFYDDALLHEPERLLDPFLGHVIDEQITVNFHTPNGLHARFITADLARLMVRGGFKTFYLGFESCSEAFQRQTGAKVLSRHLAEAVENLLAAGANRQNII